MPSRLGLARFLAAALFGALGCAPGGGDSPPNVSPLDRLHLELEQDASLPLRVISAGPEGPVEGTTLQVHLVFSKPVRELSLAEEESKLEFSIDPPIPGTLHWAGTNALTLTPNDGAVHPATAYHVRVPTTTTATDGSHLEEELAFDFETQRPQVQYLAASEASGRLGPRAVFTFSTNLPVSPRALQDLLEVTAVPNGAPLASEPTRIEVDVERDEAKPLELVVKPRAALPLDASIRFVVKSGLLSELGPLASQEPFEETYATYGPLSVTLE
jgi:hypothetical protein